MAPKIKWDMIELRCGSCGSVMHPVEETRGILYVCKNDSQADNTESTCSNRMNAEFFEMILSKIVELLSTDDDVESNLKGRIWEHRNSYHHYRFRIKSHLPNRFLVEVVNNKKSHCPY